MKVEVIDCNKLKVFITENDLREWEVDLNTIEGNNNKMETLFWNIMEALEDNNDISFDIGSSRVSIEAISRKTKGIIMLITRIDSEGADEAPEGVENNQAENFSCSEVQNLEILEKLKPSLEFLENQEENNNYKELVIFKFSNFDQVVSCLKIIKKDFFGSSTLYKYRNFYFLLLKVYETGNLNKLECTLSEFAFKVTSPHDLVIGFLEEYASCMIRKNAVESIEMFF